MAESQVIQDTPPEMDLAEVLPHLKSFLTDLLQLFTEAEDDAIQSGLLAEKNSKLLMEFLEGSSVFFLFLSYDPKGKKVKLITEIKSLKPGQTFAVFRKTGFSFPVGCSVADVLRTNIHAFNLGEIEAEFNPVLIAHVSLKNAFSPLLKDAEESKDQVLAMDQINSIATEFVKSQSIIDSIQKQISDLSFAMVQHTALKTIPDVSFPFDNYIIQACEEAKKKGRAPMLEDIPEEVLKRDQWVGNLQESLTNWGNLINILFKHWQEVTFESLAQEIEYWGKYQAAVVKVCEMINRPELQLSVKVISMKTKRTNLDFAQMVNAPMQLELVNSVSSIIKDIQFDRLEAAQSISEISSAMINIFNQIKKLLDNNNYTPVKIASMLHNFSQDLTNKLISFFRPKDVLNMPVKEFEALLSEHNRIITGVFSTQNNQMKGYLSQAAGAASPSGRWPPS
jgi:hypothetical protein